MEELASHQRKTTLTKSGLSERKKDAISAYFFISPFFILFAIFGLFPMLFSFYLAFQKYNGLGEMSFIGWKNFIWILEDPLFWKSIYNTIILGLLGTAPQILIGMILATILNATWLRFKNVFRIAIFMPYVTSILAVAIVFSVIFSNQPSGLMNTILIFLGFDPINWTTSEWGVKIAISTMVFWRWVGYNTIIFLAGLQSIPHDLYEAAEIDGASTLMKFRHITLPLLKPVILFTTFLSTIGAWQLFVEPLVFFGRLNDVRDEGMTVVLYLYREAFRNNAFGTASATAIILFFIIIIFTILNYLLTNRERKLFKRSVSR
ncbi:carbohydrate ABC transporter permease [Bacillus pinisoli]|uniref:carbohydrate ABC transporter permease n=1 Tax=Bacillus pinisoli TaxID=2901866 RepID=UPI001FF2198F|nr:sugar ABC transporter permease [Bacillus pinisoli]